MFFPSVSMGSSPKTNRGCRDTENPSAPTIKLRDSLVLILKQWKSTPQQAMGKLNIHHIAV